jgi:hypothetical protein
VHYEDVVQNPREALGRIGKFIDQQLDYDRIRQVSLGSLQSPNSSFRGDGQEAEAKTIGRWKTMFKPDEIRNIESVDAELLKATGYGLDTSAGDLHPSIAVRFMSFLYPLYFDFKLWLKSDTPLARLASTGRMGVAKTEAS